VYKYIKEGLTLIKTLSTLNKLLNILIPLISGYVDIENFKVYLLGIILQERWFSTHGISKRNETKSMWQTYDFLMTSINWQKIYYTLANYAFVMFMGFNWYLVVDGSPLKQPYAEYRITKRGFICIKGIKNMPHNELICLSLTNGIVYIPLDFRIWTSPKITNKRDYKKKTELFSAMLYEYLIKRIPVKTILFDNGFASMTILRWLNNHGFTWFTRIKANKNVRYNGKKCHLKDLNLEIDQSVILEMIGVKGLVKIIRTCHQDEIVYIATNLTTIEDKQLIEMYKQRWKCEVFHRNGKQHLGLEYIYIRNWQKLQNHVGFVCLAHALLSILQQSWGGSIGYVKHIIHDEVYQIHDAHERLLQKLAA
jgi:hypothetical protein